ncbi:bacteriophage abortive infection AbiH family protein [Apilactobacillus apinorum]|nr:bacteriophage abortive infection AbiH family protein [Apilactobacillus apinorum]
MLKKFEEKYDDELKYARENTDVNNLNYGNKIFSAALNKTTDDLLYASNLLDNSKTLDSINFWLFLLIWINFKDEKNKNWYDIEKCIKNFLTDEASSIFRYKTIKLEKYKLLINSLNNNVNWNNPDTTNNVDLIILVAIYNKIKKDEDLFAFLFNQLNEFEKSFSDYIREQIEQKDYFSKNRRFITNICNNRLSNILSFNYIPLTGRSFEENNLSDNTELKYINNYENIHGNVYNEINYRFESPIIFGIDSNYDSKNKIDEKYKSHINKFTKTSRILNFSNRKTSKILDKNIDTIIFFGHSLGDADYSYFQSIFDYYHIYDSNIKIIFLYSLYNSEIDELHKIKEQHDKASDKRNNQLFDNAKTQKISNHYEDRYNQMDINRKEKQEKQVFQLINNYGATLNNKNHGKNLLNKLILENRIQLLNIDEFTLKYKNFYPKSGDYKQ